MAKTNPDGTITIQGGDTLYGIYGPNWKQASGYSGDPTKLAIGTVLPAPGKSQSSTSVLPGPPSAPASTAATASTSSGSLTPDNGTGVSPSSYNQYLDIANARNAQPLQNNIDAINQAAQIEQQSYSDLASKTRGQEPLVRQVYADLAKELQQGQADETATAQQVGQQNIGTARAANASAGIDIGTGSLTSNVAQAQQQEQSDVKKVADDYNIKYTTLADQLNQSVSQLESQAAQYEAQGQQVQAAKITQIAQLKQQYDQLTQQEASDMLTAANDQQKNQIQDAYNASRLQIQQEQAEIAAQHLSIDQQNADTSAYNAKVNAAKVQNDINTSAQAAANKAVGKITQTQDVFNNPTGLNFFTDNGQPISAGEYLAKQPSSGGTVSLSQLAQILSTSPNPSDQKKASDLMNGKYKTIGDFVKANQYLFQGVDPNSIVN